MLVSYYLFLIFFVYFKGRVQLKNVKKFNFFYRNIAYNYVSLLKYTYFSITL